MESRFSNVHYLLHKQRHILNIERGDFWLQLKNQQLNIRALSAHQARTSH